MNRVYRGSFYTEAPTYFNLSRLLKRGWTREMVDEILGKPDHTTANPFKKDGPRQKLYFVFRVKRHEKEHGICS